MCLLLSKKVFRILIEFLVFTFLQRDGIYQGNVVDFRDMTIKYVDNKALSGKAADEPVLKIQLKDKNGVVFKEDWVHYKYIHNVDR